MLLNIILDEDIIRACTALCGALENKIGVIIGDLYDGACEAVVNDFLNFTSTPHSTAEGSTFVFDCSFVSVNDTGTGTIVIDFVDPKNRTVSNLYWLEARKPGTYPEKIGFNTLSILFCNPTEIRDSWPLKTYNVTAQVCNGECGSQHPHSSTYDIAKGSFEITKKKIF